MYDRPETRDVTDRFWAHTRDALREQNVEAPDSLTRNAQLMEQWTSPDLVLSQTCGLPFRKFLAGKVTVVARPDFGFHDTDPGDYRSVIITRAHIRTLPHKGALMVARNDETSQSGWAALRDWCAYEGHTVADIVETGSHVASARAVSKGLADIAAIDAQTWRLILRHENWAPELFELAWTPPMPGLPYITRHGEAPEPYFVALTSAFDRLGEDDRRALGLCGIVPATASDYLNVPDPDTRAPYRARRMTGPWY